jgi:hypothetical protein
MTKSLMAEIGDGTFIENRGPLRDTNDTKVEVTKIQHRLCKIT